MIENPRLLDERKKEAVSKLMGNPLFIEFLEILKESREKTHQSMYGVNDPWNSAYLQGQAKTLFDIINFCYTARDLDKGDATPRKGLSNPVLGQMY